MVKVISFFQAVLYLISSVLFVPVIVSLVLLFFYTVYLSGIVVGEFLSRRRGKRAFVEAFKIQLDELVKSGCDDVEIENLLRRFEKEMSAPLDKLRMLVRIGPSLGLMGTLIPMGVGLAALSKGQIEKLTSSMIIAFTTTVVGLAVAVIAYILATAKNRWFYEDITFMEYVAERVLGDGKVYEEKKKV